MHFALNPYQYGNQNPYTYSDPSGNCPMCVVNPYTVSAAIAGGTALAHGLARTAPAITNIARSTARTTASFASQAKQVTARVGQSVREQGNLIAHEGPRRGHTILEHVGKANDQLIARANSGRVSAASTYNNQAAAARVVSRTIQQNQGKIDAWLKNGARGRLSLNYSSSSIIGRGVQAGQKTVTNQTNALTILKSNGKGSYDILTSFPRP